MELDVYVEAGCRFCDRALQLAAELDADFPALSVRIIDIGRRERPFDVFAVPTFVLNGELFSLGNPDAARLRDRVHALLEDRLS